jgi:hypothetical protein
LYAGGLGNWVKAFYNTGHGSVHIRIPVLAALGFGWEQAPLTMN